MTHTITKAWFAPAPATIKHLFSVVLLLHPMISCTPSVFVALSTKGDGLASRLQTDDLAETFGSVSKMAQTTAHKWVISVSIFKALRCVGYLYSEHAYGSLTNNMLYTVFISAVQLVLYILQSLQRPIVSESLPESVLDALQIKKGAASNK